MPVSITDDFSVVADPINGKATTTGGKTWNDPNGSFKSTVATRIQSKGVAGYARIDAGVAAATVQATFKGISPVDGVGLAARIAGASSFLFLGAFSGVSAFHWVALELVGGLPTQMVDIPVFISGNEVAKIVTTATDASFYVNGTLRASWTINAGLAGDTHFGFVDGVGTAGSAWDDFSIAG